MRSFLTSILNPSHPYHPTVILLALYPVLFFSIALTDNKTNSLSIFHSFSSQALWRQGFFLPVVLTYPRNLSQAHRNPKQTNDYAESTGAFALSALCHQLKTREASMHFPTSEGMTLNIQISHTISIRCNIILIIQSTINYALILAPRTIKHSY